jgi:enolase-phosphatase E1
VSDTASQPHPGDGPAGPCVRDISHILLDIEGTTCPVSFVAETLFPYARAALPVFLREHGEQQPVVSLIRELQQSREMDVAAHPDVAAMELAAYGQWLIDHDRKVAPLKELQGLIWEEGYRRGDLRAPLFEEVADTLRQWHQQEMVLGVYSSGSVKAQKLLYRYSGDGDLTPLFSHWFDTRTGNKKEASSYRRIAATMNTSPEDVLFVSDAKRELLAAAAVGMKTIFSDREGNPERQAGGFARLERLDELSLETKKRHRCR